MARPIGFSKWPIAPVPPRVFKLCWLGGRCAVDGCAVTTVEGIGNARDKGGLHAVQERMALGWISFIHKHFLRT